MLTGLSSRPASKIILKRQQWLYPSKESLMAIRRKDLVDSESGGYYHLVSRCVRRAFLCGKDDETGRCFEHRRQWIEDRIIQLAEIFSIEVYGYAVMHNHYHLIIYSDPLAPNQWSDLEVATRWLALFPGKLNEPKFKLQREMRIQAITNDKDLLAKYRERLGSISWLMRCINEPIAKMSNQEDFVKGHFWESRFRSQALLDEAAALTCMAYVDLNPIRAGITYFLQTGTISLISYLSYIHLLTGLSSRPASKIILKRQQWLYPSKESLMAIRRKDLVDSESGGYYHLVSRCVRRAFLCGKDDETGRCFEHRRQWIEGRIIQLAEIFSIEVYGYAVMHNHYHLIIYSDPLAPNQWSDLEVATRWLALFPGKLNEPKFKLQREMRIQAITNDKDLLAKYRERLGSISWLMRCINEPIAKMSNQEDFVKGHFWESRFRSQALLDEAAALTCMAYVDLNPIRAGITQCLEESAHTSIQKRLISMTENELSTAMQAIAGSVRERTMTVPLKDYIDLVEWTGKSICYPDKSSIPPHLFSVFERLNLNQKSWLSQVNTYGNNYYRMVGSFKAIAEKTQSLKQKWIKGIKAAKNLYLAPD